MFIPQALDSFESLDSSSFSDRLSDWTEDSILSYAKSAIKFSSEKKSIYCDPVFQINPLDSSSNESSAFVRSCSLEFWVRNLRKQLRYFREVSALTSGNVSHDSSPYSSKSSIDFQVAKDMRASDFFKNFSVFDSTLGSFSIPNLTERQRASKHYALLKAIEALGVASSCSWLMLTITLPSEYHANPKHKYSSVEWNGSTPDKSNKFIATQWNKLRANLTYNNISISGIRVEEPQQDSTPHWHVGFFYHPSDFDSICRFVLKAFPNGLKIRRRLSTGSYELKHYASEASFLASDFSLNNDFLPASCQIDLGVAKTGDSEKDSKTASFSSYMTKYVFKSLGLNFANPDSSTDDLFEANNQSSFENITTDLAVKAHRKTYGIRAIQFFGIPSGASTLWDTLRRIPYSFLDSYFSDPSSVPSFFIDLIKLVRQPKGSGFSDFLFKLGGLAVDPVKPQFEFEFVKTASKSKYLEESQAIRALTVSLSCDPTASYTYTFPVGRSLVHKSKAESLDALLADHSLFQCTMSGADAASKGLVSLSLTKSDPSGALSKSQCLSVEQAVAVKSAIDSNAVVVASAGAGKTFVIFERVKYLLSQGVNPSKIVVLTYNRDTALSLQRKYLSFHSANSYSFDPDLIFVGTIHSYAYSLLSKAKFDLESQDSNDPSFFDNLLVLATNRFSRSKTVLLDESQDLTSLQWAFVRSISSVYFSVGDPRQSIYSFLDASDFLSEAKQSVDLFSAPDFYELTSTYRCSYAVTAFSNYFSPYPDLSPAKPATDNEGSVSVFSYLNSDSLRASLISKLLALKSADPLSSIIVLTYTNAEAAYLSAFVRVCCSSHSWYDEDSIKFSTVHGYKGLESDHVLLYLDSTTLSLTTTEDLSLFYVAITRARITFSIYALGALPQSVYAFFR